MINEMVWQKGVICHSLVVNVFKTDDTSHEPGLPNLLISFTILLLTNGEITLGTLVYILQN